MLKNNIRELRDGYADHPTAETLAKSLPSKARVGGAEESGRPTRKHGTGEDRKQGFLEKKATGSSKGRRDSARKLRQKQVEEERNQKGKVIGIIDYFEEKVGGPTSNLGTSGKQQRRADSPEPAPGQNQEREILEKEPTGVQSEKFPALSCPGSLGNSGQETGGNQYCEAGWSLRMGGGSKVQPP